MNYKVKWTKEFVAGHLKGIWFDSELGFITLELATEYVAFLHKHKTKPVTPCVGTSSYICHMARIVVD